MTQRMAAISTEFARVTVEVDEGGNAIDPTDQPVWLAFVAEGATPDSGDWILGEWEGDGGVEHTARALATTLPAGRYDIWVRVDWSPESMRKPAEKLVVT